MSTRVLCVASFKNGEEKRFPWRKGAIIVFERISQSCSSSQEELLLLTISSSSCVTLSLPECIVVYVASQLKRKIVQCHIGRHQQLFTDTFSSW